jgi:hypothetical protein
MTRQQVLDLYFLDARGKLIDIAAFLDRLARAEGKEDFRGASFRKALRLAGGPRLDKARRVLLAFSDPSRHPVPVALGKGACGAWSRPGKRPLPAVERARRKSKAKRS